jgi:hypothetical protein
MTPSFKDCGSPQDARQAREPLVDIDVEPAPAGAPTPQLAGRRKRLSEVQSQTADPEPEPKSQRRRLSETVPDDREEPASEPPSASAGAGLIDVQPHTALLEAPQAIAGTRTNDDATGPAQVEQWVAQLHTRHSFPIAAGGGLLAGVIGALAWAAITAAMNAPTTWMAIGVGLLVGGAVRILGQGLDRSFGRLGAGLSLFACVLGNCLANSTFVARDVGLSVTSVLAQISPSALPRLIVATFHPLDIVFYAAALYLGYRLSFRRLTSA